MFENERWLLEAQDILQQAKTRPLYDAGALEQQRLLRQWSILRSCAIIRAGSILVGTRRTNSLLWSISMEEPHLELSDLEDDLGFSWYLPIETKRSLASIIMARWEIAKIGKPMYSLAMQQSVNALLDDGEPSQSKAARSTCLDDLDKFDADISQWESDHRACLRSEESLSWARDGDRPVLVQKAFLRLCYE